MVLFEYRGKKLKCMGFQYESSGVYILLFKKDILSTTFTHGLEAALQTCAFTIIQEKEAYKIREDEEFVGKLINFIFRMDFNG